MAKKIFLAVFLSTIFISCRRSPTAPTGPDSANLSYWRPCVVVQVPGQRSSNEFNVQMNAVKRLQAAGRMDWVRLGAVSLSGLGKDYAVEAKRTGLKVLAIISLEDLEKGQSWESVFEQFYIAFPEVDVWEIAGEISNPEINPRPVTPEYYMGKFKKLYSNVKLKHPQVVLASSPTFGSVGGPEELEKFIELGLLEMDVIVAVNLYTENALQQYSVVFDRYAANIRNHRIWVTETSASTTDRQLDWVERSYPRIINTMRPEMICWYVLWDGDNNSSNASYGLIDHVQTPPLIESSLFKKLTGGN